MEHWENFFFSKKSPQNTFKTRLDTYGNNLGQIRNIQIFAAFLELWKFLVFFENFRKLDPPWKTGPKIFGKLAPKLVQNTFGYFWERFWAFLEFWNFFDFFENFRKLDPPWSTGHKIIGTKITPKHFWTLLETIVDIFGSLTFFKLFWKFSKSRASMEHWAKKIFEKIVTKHVQNTFGQFWERLWANLEFWEFFYFFQNLEVSSLLGTLVKNFFFWKNHLKTRSKHVWTLLGTI